MKQPTPTIAKAHGMISNYIQRFSSHQLDPLLGAAAPDSP
jgi:hypothetical protein